MYQVIETFNGKTTVKMVDSFKNCQARAKQLKNSKQRKHGYKVEVVLCENNEKFNTKTPGIWNEKKYPLRETK